MTGKLSLAATQVDPAERDRRWIKFCRTIVRRPHGNDLETVLVDAGVAVGVDPTRRVAFDSRRLRSQVIDCLDILGFLSFLFRKLDDAVHVPR